MKMSRRRSNRYNTGEQVIMKLLIGLVFVGAVGAVGFNFYWNFSGLAGEKARQAAEEVAASNGMTIFSGTNFDQDGNGYITFTLKDPKTGKLASFECAALPWNSGCKLVPMFQNAQPLQ